MKEKNLNRKENGITLIALVITIIVLLILAGVAISMLSGENGILNQAAKAKTSTDVAKLSESIKLAATTVMTSVEHKLTEEEFKTELEKDGYKVNEDGTVTQSNVKYALTNKGAVKATIEDLKKEEAALFANTILEDKNGHTITIPMNFNISSESPILVTEGMIIEDSEQNQYVWIPVFSSEQYDWGVVYPNTLPAKTADESEFTSTHISAIKTALKSYTSTYALSSYSDAWYGNASYGKYGYYAEDDTEQKNLIYYTNGNMTQTEYTTLYNNMLKSVYKNGGFYIGRYEMGISVVTSIDEAQKNSRTRSSKEYAVSYINSTNEAPTIEGMTVPISKANAIGYNYITQSQAQMLAKKLGEKSEYSNVISSIMFGVQWDAVCVFIEKFDTNNTATTKSDWLTSNDYCKLWGNYSSSTFKLNQGYYTPTFRNDLLTWSQDCTTEKQANEEIWLCTTGASDQNSSLNIYDFGGNLSEWTLERRNNPDTTCSIRGSYFVRNMSACDRESHFVYDSFFNRL